MAPRIDVRIDPESHTGDTAVRPRNRRDAVELSRGLRIDGANSVCDRVLELLARLADAGEHDLLRRKSRTLSDGNFAAGVGIGAASERPEQPRDRKGRVRFQRVVDRVRVRRERLVDAAIAFADRARAVYVSGCACAFDDRLDADAVAGKCATCGPERLVHERIACYHAPIPAIEAPHVTDGC